MIMAYNLKTKLKLIEIKKPKTFTKVTITES